MDFFYCQTKLCAFYCFQLTSDIILASNDVIEEVLLHLWGHIVDNVSVGSQFKSVDYHGGYEIDQAIL